MKHVSKDQNFVPRPGTVSHFTFVLPFVSSVLFLVLLLVNPHTVSSDGPFCMQNGLGPSDMMMSNGAMNPKYMWYRVGNKIQIPVVIDHSYSYKELKVVLGGLMEIESKSCVEFYIFHGNHTLRGHDYVYITRQYKGCWSYVGRVGRGLQEVSLPPGCINHRTAVHEMMHALGFSHEHVRYDRDQHVHIFWQNIMPGREKNFRKHKSQRSYFGPYDYQSIMHYQRTAFSKNKRDTIEPFKPGVRIGIFKHMSFWDSEKLNRMYKCGRGKGRGRNRYFNPPHVNNVLHDEDDVEPGFDGNSFSSPSDYLLHEGNGFYQGDHHEDDHEIHEDDYNDANSHPISHPISHSQANYINSSPNTNPLYNFNNHSPFFSLF